MGCFQQEMVTDPRFPEIGKKVHYLKEDKKGVGIMCQALEKIRNDGRAEGMDMALCNSIKSVMESLKCTMEKAMDILNIPVESRDKYKKLM